MSEHELTAEQVAEVVRVSRHAQGLPERVADPVALRSVAVVIGAVAKGQGAG
jgi:hypothetical protein